MPPLDGAVQRGEGVALVLLGDAIAGWEVAGKQWKSWSARMVSCFKIGEKPHDILHVVSCYAPTWGSSRVMKDEFGMTWNPFWLKYYQVNSGSFLETSMPELAQGTILVTSGMG